MTEIINEPKRRFGRELKGIVVSDKMDKTVTVAVTNLVRHSIYKKFIKRTKKYHAHDSLNKSTVGDVVLIKEAKPYSKTKRWRVSKIVKTHQE